MSNMYSCSLAELASQVLLRDGEIFGKRHLRSCFEWLVSGPGELGTLYDLDLPHLYAVAALCESGCRNGSCLELVTPLASEGHEEIVANLIDFGLVAGDSHSGLRVTDLGEKFVIDIALETLKTERALRVAEWHESTTAIVEVE